MSTSLLTLAQVRDGTGFPADARFALVELPPAIDPLSIAYMAIGAYDTLVACEEKEGKHPDLDQWGGQLGFIGEVIRHVDVIERIYAERPDDYGGVFVYEVAEPFGRYIADMLLSGEPLELETTARGLIADDIIGLIGVPADEQ